MAQQPLHHQEMPQPLLMATMVHVGNPLLKIHNGGYWIWHKNARSIPYRLFGKVHTEKHSPSLLPIMEPILHRLLPFKDNLYQASPIRKPLNLQKRKHVISSSMVQNVVHNMDILSSNSKSSKRVPVYFNHSR